MTYKCKICGGQATIDSNNGVVVCNYCGTKQALPLFTADSERLLYDRGNNYLLHSEYDKAENVFNQLLTIKPGAAELYWDLVLCKYGVTYVKDPKTGKYIPTCNRTHYTPIFSDENYKKAIELSSGEKKALFEEDAKTIDNIQKGIIAVSKKEKPFDIFISYKETDANGNRTKDSIEAQKLYEKLTEAGYKVFFSRITLEDKIGTEYEPYIYAALYSSKVMLTICSSKENIEAVWVKNEWSRFLGFRQNDNSKTLLPLYFGMDKAELPEEFALLSTYDIHTDGFDDELLRGIKKLIPLPIMKAKRRKQILKATGIVAASLVVVAGIAAAIIIPKELEDRRIAAEEAERASEAAALEAKYEDSYQAAMTLFDNADYTAAEAAFIALGDYKDSAHMAARCPIQPDYDAAMQYYYDGKYAQATWAFEALGDYEDSAAQKEKAELSWRKSLANLMSDDYYNSGIDTYYITPNGAVADFNTGGEKIKIGEHGKVISITNGNGELLLLYEDGVAMRKNASSNEVLEDVIQIVPTHWIAGDIVLKSDGSVYVEGLSEKDAVEYKEVAGCFANISKWKNIVMLSAWASSYGNADFSMVLSALDADGNVYVCSTGLVYADMSILPDDFKNVTTLSVKTESTAVGYNAVALTNDGKMISYIDGQLSVYDANDTVDICVVYDAVYTLSADGKLRKFGSNKVILNDVVKIGQDSTIMSEGYAITRSGAMYQLDGSEIRFKTVVYDEWLSRMG